MSIAPILVAMVTRPDVPNPNGVTFSSEACKALTEHVNKAPLLVTVDPAPDVVNLDKVAAETVPGSAKFDGQRIEVQVRVLDTPSGNLVREKLMSGALSMGHVVHVDDGLPLTRPVLAEDITGVSSLYTMSPYDKEA